MSAENKSTKPFKAVPSVDIPGVAWVDGKFCPIGEATLPVLDFGFLRSDATYDVVHVWGKRFFQLNLHLERFRNSVDALRLQLPVSDHELSGILAECVRRSGLENAYVEMLLTRGVSSNFSRDPREATNRLICFAIPFGSIATEEQKQRGLNVQISNIQRIAPESIDPKVKNYHWLDFVQALYQGFDEGYDNVVMIDARGNITEGPGFNVFIVENGSVLTPSSGVLEGITRHCVIELCKSSGIPIELSPIAGNRMRTADEVFISSTAGGVMPVSRVDGQAIADGTTGPLTQRIIDAYWGKHSDPSWSVALDELPDWG